MVLLDVHPTTCRSIGSRQTTTEYPVALYREFLSYVKTKYPGEYWHALPKEVAEHTSSKFAPPKRTPDEYDELASLKNRRLCGKTAAVLLFSHFPADPRPRRAAEALAAQGVNIDLICLRDGDASRHMRLTVGSTSPVSRLKRQRGGKLGYIGQYTAFLLISFFYLASRSLRRRYDLVHVHNMPDVLVFSATVPKLLGAKVILDLHDPMPELMQTIFRLPENSFSVVALKRLEQWSIRFADLVLTVNLACKKIYSSRSCQPDKIKVVINSPDDEIFRFQRGDVCDVNGKNGNSSEPFVILYHGSLVHRNGFDLAVESLEKVRRTIPSVRLTCLWEANRLLRESDGIRPTTRTRRNCRLSRRAQSQRNRRGDRAL